MTGSKLARVVGVDHVARGAAGRTIIARVVVGAKKIERRIEKSRFLQTQIDRIGAVIRAKSARAQPFVGFASLFFFVRIADLETAFAAAFEYTQNVSGLRYFPTGQRIQDR